MILTENVEKVFEVQEDIESLFQSWEKQSNRNLIDYKFHVYRVWNLCLKLSGLDDSRNPELFRLLAITSAFHDSEYFINKNWDYLNTSNQKMIEYLKLVGLEDLSDIASLTLFNHHLLKIYRGPHFRIVESFRKADLIDFPGWRLHGIDKQYLKQLRKVFPYRNFRFIVWFETFKQFLKSPFSGLPMLRKTPYTISCEDAK
ncbi:hypothetical protein JWG40_06370 [Leptospira sp. 201903074]|uniref:hypothetical protein n=1 Tax=Leptospira abararensis TaxID=2810036 RepID=UPI0019627759|nr:hypothetical protein [Leptospira abararensis]MBM9546635.1 hypothetical protein [Leptospira abararensis]